MSDSDHGQPVRDGVKTLCRFCSPPSAQSSSVESCTPLVLQFELEESQDVPVLKDLFQLFVEPQGLVVDI